MELKKTLRSIAGYVIGGPLFLLLVPYALYKLSLVIGLNIKLTDNSDLRIIIAAIIFIIGMTFAIWSNITLHKIGKGGPLQGAGIEISPKTQKLVITGPYKYTRNPMMFGACMYYYSLAIFYNSLSCILVVTGFMIIALTYLKLSEEKRLIEDFGKDYEDYRKKVSFFIPFPYKYEK
jgi:protein-S-isoprenylcysteine O-methyltransferase Ste14